MPEPRLSVLVVAKNEGHNLADCLASTRWADERIVVVDASSRDDTLAVAEREADVVAVRNFDDFASQRNTALALASGDWVLSIDEVGVFKPHPRVYRLACERLGRTAETIAFVSSNAWDAHAAAFGMRAVWCNRQGQPDERLPGRILCAIASLAQLPPLFARSPPPSA